MDITDKTVDELAHLARLQFEGEEKERIKKRPEQNFGVHG
tara:strand:+ start:157 stop:276 length:120 start_codon:yes stop_codon:yes gene_type:complete